MIPRWLRTEVAVKGDCPGMVRSERAGRGKDETKNWEFCLAEEENC